MKALVITNLYPPHALGGYEMSCHDAVERWLLEGKPPKPDLMCS